MVESPPDLYGPCDLSVLGAAAEVVVEREDGIWLGFLTGCAAGEPGARAVEIARSAMEAGFRAPPSGLDPFDELDGVANRVDLGLRAKHGPADPEGVGTLVLAHLSAGEARIRWTGEGGATLIRDDEFLYDAWGRSDSPSSRWIHSHAGGRPSDSSELVTREIGPWPLCPGDRLLLGAAALRQSFSPEEIQRLIRGDSAEFITQELVAVGSVRCGRAPAVAVMLIGHGASEPEHEADSFKELLSGLSEVLPQLAREPMDDPESIEESDQDPVTATAPFPPVRVWAPPDIEHDLHPSCEEEPSGQGMLYGRAASDPHDAALSDPSPRSARPGLSHPLISEDAFEPGEAADASPPSPPPARQGETARPPREPAARPPQEAAGPVGESMSSSRAEPAPSSPLWTLAPAALALALLAGTLLAAAFILF